MQKNQLKILFAPLTNITKFVSENNVILKLIITV